MLRYIAPVLLAILVAYAAGSFIYDSFRNMSQAIRAAVVMPPKECEDAPVKTLRTRQEILSYLDCE